jgi:PKD repeat protein
MLKHRGNKEERPQTVQFTSHSSGDFGTISWNFGDGATSGQIHPIHRYTLSETYTVTLSERGLGGSDQLVRSNYIRVVEAAAAIHLPIVLKH